MKYLMFLFCLLHIQLSASALQKVSIAPESVLENQRSTNLINLLNNTVQNASNNFSDVIVTASEIVRIVSANSSIPDTSLNIRRINTIWALMDNDIKFSNEVKSVDYMNSIKSLLESI